jgi:hypothetical protein
MYCCGCCNIIQMARHTHDEHVYKYQCCNTTGLPRDAPQVVWTRDQFFFKLL